LKLKAKIAAHQWRNYTCNGSAKIYCWREFLKKYDYDIVVKLLTKPLGEFRYNAKVSIFHVQGRGDDQQVKDSFGEEWGRTENEAYSKMREKVEQWISQNP